MSNDKAIAAVTKTLQRHLFQRLAGHPDLPGAQVTTKAPDQARPDGGGGRQLNLFLYRTSIDAAWRNQIPVDAHPGEDRQPALPLVLSYLLTAYGDGDDEVDSHQILGLAMSTLNDQPLLARTDIAAAFPGSGLENQVERVRITPHPIPMDEISRLWATFQTGYRISVSYDVAVVLIDDSSPALAAPPVLSRGEGDAGPSAAASLPPNITTVRVPGGRPAALPGDAVHLVGARLGGVKGVQVSGERMPAPRTLPVSAVADAGVTVSIPSEGKLLPAGTLLLTPIGAGGPGNTVALRLAPTLVIAAPPLTLDLVDGAGTLTVGCTPPVLPDQTVALIVGDRIVAGTPRRVPTAEPTFALSGFTAGRFLLRLRVDDQDSLPITAADPTGYDDAQYVVLT